MTFNPLKEKGLPLEKQQRNWHQIVGKPYKKQKVDCYTRTRQILMNGIEVEAWGFKHQFNRFMAEIDDKVWQKLMIKTEQISQEWDE